jgi:hypothetical protein
VGTVGELSDLADLPSKQGVSDHADLEVRYFRLASWAWFRRAA